jgi:hypothetical protein
MTMPGRDFRRNRLQFDDVVRRSTPVVEPSAHAHRMAIAMFWGVTLSIVLWAGFLAIVL